MMRRTALAIGLLAAAAAGEEPVTVLLRELREGGDARTRARAAWQLGYRRDTLVSSALKAALGDPAPVVRHQAAVSLSLLAPELGAGVPALVASLRASDRHRRWQACVALRRLGPRARAAAPALAQVLCAPDLDTCREAAHALETVGGGSPATVRRLRWLSLGFHVTDQRALARAIDAVDPDRRARGRAGVPLAPLVAELASDSPKQRAWAATEIATLLFEDERRRRTVAKALAEVLEDPSPEVRRAARAALRVHGMQADLPRTRHRNDVLGEFLARLPGAGRLADSLRAVPDAVFGPLPLGDDATAAYARLRPASLDDETEARLVDGLAHLFWEDPDFGGDLLHYGPAELRAVVALVVPRAALPRDRADLLLRYAAGDRRTFVRLAARHARDALGKDRVDRQTLVQAVPDGGMAVAVELARRFPDEAGAVPVLVRGLSAPGWFRRWEGVRRPGADRPGRPPGSPGPDPGRAHG